ncbi:MAG: hypothetical protein ACR2G5_02040 [Pyrinomonadaceae bacterium]
MIESQKVKKKFVSASLFYYVKMQIKTLKQNIYGSFQVLEHQMTFKQKKQANAGFEPPQSRSAR